MSYRKSKQPDSASPTLTTKLNMLKLQELRAEVRLKGLLHFKGSSQKKKKHSTPKPQQISIKQAKIFKIFGYKKTNQNTNHMQIFFRTQSNDINSKNKIKIRILSLCLLYTYTHRRF
jgi:hypothetical protein